MQRTERLILLTQLLTERPQAVLSLASLSEQWGIAKSTLSEDVALVRQTLAEAGTGRVETLVGVQGGVRYRSLVSDAVHQSFVEGLATRLSTPERVLAGGFVYLSDVLGDPHVLDLVGRIVSNAFEGRGINVVVTVETKGIPLATAVARHFNVPIAIVRREQRVTEGAAVSTHYVSGSTKRIQTMSLGKRAMPRDAKALVVDDFMRAGATAKAVTELLHEFDAEVVGTAVFMVTSEPTEKMVKEYYSVLRVHDVGERGVDIRPSALVAKRTDEGMELQ